MNTEIRELTTDELDQASGGHVTMQQIMKVYNKATSYGRDDLTMDLAYAAVGAEVAGGCCN